MKSELTVHGPNGEVERLTAMVEVRNAYPIDLADVSEAREELTSEFLGARRDRIETEADALDLAARSEDEWKALLSGGRIPVLPAGPFFQASIFVGPALCHYNLLREIGLFLKAGSRR